MRQIGILVLGNFKESVRDKLLLTMLGGGIILLGMIAVMSPLNLGARDKTFHDIGLAWIHISGMLILLLLGAWTIHREREKGIWLTVLTRPISRSQFMLGRLMGLLTTLAFTIVASTLIYSIIAMITGIGILPGIWRGALFIFLEMSLLAGLVLFFSSITGFAMTIFMAMAIFFAGHMSSDLLRAAVLAESSVLSGVMMFLNWLLPHMEMYRIRGALVGGDLPTVSQILHTACYSLFYLSALFALSMAIFSRKDIR
ncbi:MAG: ABC transporter permease subunit [bacterium]|nr:ABC transporter permease subunit [bacterium]